LGVRCRQDLVDRQVDVLTNRRLVTALVALLLVNACALVRSEPDPDPNAPCPIPPPIAAATWISSPHASVIEGTVLRVDSLNDSTPKPLTDAHVLVTGPVQRSVVVDSAGHFRLAALPDGQYAVSVRRLGYPTRRDSLHVGVQGAFGEIRLKTDVILFPNCCHSRICL
jgi:hypothetical protein